MGEGGQGEVFLVRKPARTSERQNAKATAVRSFVLIGGRDFHEAPEGVTEELLKAITEYNRPETPGELGALKEFKISSHDPEEQERATARLESEVRALEKVKHPGVLKLLHSNVAQRFIVTEYHPEGTLDKNLSRFQADRLAALQAFGKLVDGVIEIHAQGAIHRDIKPENIFVAASGDLVLGTSGSCFSKKRRLTTTFERVGSHFWMAPWAYDNARLELNQIKPALDIYPLGKVLWSMISGRNGFKFWEYDREENNLERMFPDDPIMPLVNGVLSKCVVRDEKDCSLSAEILRLAVDSLIREIKTDRGFRPAGAQQWPCPVCGRGKYQRATSETSQGQGQVEIRGAASMKHMIFDVPFDVYICDWCKHAALFGR